MSESAAKTTQRQLHRSLAAKLRYGARILPGLVRHQIFHSRPSGRVHLIIALADHFEPAIVPDDGRKRAPRDVQEQRVERWCNEYPALADEWRDNDGYPFQHTYFYPAEQFDAVLIDRLAEHCHDGWGEIGIHLHHGVDAADTPENTRRTLTSFRDELEGRGCVSYLNGAGPARYAFVHGNFALANSGGGCMCGVDAEIQILADTGCYADLTLPAASFDPAQIAKINSLYECALPLTRRAAHSKGRDLAAGRSPRVFPLMVQGPLLLTFNSGRLRIENGALVGTNPASLRRLQLWKQAAICVKGRPDWLFIKLHCHSMDPTHESAIFGDDMRSFLRELVTGAADRNEVLHFCSAREMVNIALAACDGREGNPGDFRGYRLKRVCTREASRVAISGSEVVAKA
jgi:hypothetical protein